MISYGNGPRPLKNPAIFTTLKKTMDFFEVTGGRVLSFRNVSVGEPAGPDLSGQCGGGKTPPWIHCWKDQPGSLGIVLDWSTL